MADDLDLGPVDFFLVGFPPGAPLDGGAIAEIARLERAGLVRILDALIVRKDADGSIAGVDLDAAGVVAFEGVRTGLLGDDDLKEAADAMEPGSVAALVVYENSWARGFVTAVHERGGVFLGSGRVDMADLVAALDAADD
jgi:uncharacterized membrane protein